MSLLVNLFTEPLRYVVSDLWPFLCLSPDSSFTVTVCPWRLRYVVWQVATTILVLDPLWCFHRIVATIDKDTYLVFELHRLSFQTTVPVRPLRNVGCCIVQFRRMFDTTALIAPAYQSSSSTTVSAPIPISCLCASLIIFSQYRYGMSVTVCSPGIRMLQSRVQRHARWCYVIEWWENRYCTHFN